MKFHAPTRSESFEYFKKSYRDADVIKKNKITYLIGLSPEAIEFIFCHEEFQSDTNEKELYIVFNLLDKTFNETIGWKGFDESRN